MTLSEKIREQLKEAMKAKDSLNVSVLRGLIAGFTNQMIAKGKKPQEIISDEEVLIVIRLAVKQRKDSIEQFTKGGRADLVDKEKMELKILEAYLPPQLSREEIESKAKALKEKMGLPAQAGVTDKTKIGPFMGALMSELKGQADGKLVKEVVDKLFE
ncbi:MAG: GatB/YqeY domain-containing protein [Patescibacteria group bacterium]